MKITKTQLREMVRQAIQEQVSQVNDVWGMLDKGTLENVDDMLKYLSMCVKRSLSGKQFPGGNESLVDLEAALVEWINAYGEGMSAAQVRDFEKKSSK